MKIIGLLGNQGVGKSYISQYISDELYKLNKKSIILAFADHFKIDCVCKHNIEYNRVFGDKDLESRKLLQKVGTEEGRDVFGQNIWINVVENWIKVFYSRGIEYFIISDVRFLNEVEWIKSINGIVIKINAPERHKICLKKESNNNLDNENEIKAHISEIEINKITNYDLIINNDFEKNNLHLLDISLL
tara:strand:- start:1817 stop:2383 length:567 start_codon:yes stop_codon:yes gene_type:complete